MPEPKILFLDIETFPNLAWTWGKYDQNVLAFEKETCIAAFAAKWGNGPVFARALPDYEGYEPRSYDDSKLVAELHRLVSEADIIVAHNGADFDIRVMNGRFIAHKMPPPPPYKVVDTKRAVKRVARFNSNKLDDLSKQLEGSRKLKTDFDLWLGCINGDPKAWAKMVRYNKRDVLLLEKLYLRIRPWINNHPNVTLLAKDAKCPKCGSRHIQWRGSTVAQTRIYARFQCQKCGGWGRAVKSSGGSQVTT